MRASTDVPDHGVVAENVLAAPRLYRRADHKVLGGVASGIADHLRISPTRVRVVFILLTFANGLGIILYGAYWIVVPTPPGSERRTRVADWLRYVVGVVMVAGTVFTVARTLPPFGQLLIPATLAIFGTALIWRQASETRRLQWRTSLTRTGRLRLALGVALVVAGGVVVVVGANASGVTVALLAVVMTVIGLALLTGPWWIRMVSDLGEERSERIRSQERAELAAHLHDSVLQTLALIQRNASSPREVTRLARGQERELRTLLYGARAASGQLSEALRGAAGEIEDAYAIKVDVVVVGDAPLTERLGALVAACREALVNAAKHAGVETVSLYAEVEDGACLCFVRDRGSGFDPAAVDPDRHGLRGSIIGRVERHGGQVSVRSSPGAGTEVEIRMPK
ncbi:MAG TPA: PspC domain-containing protein [Jatrophihabitantaceae bacterium]